MCFWFDQPSLKIPWVLCKTYLILLENLKGECLKILILGKPGLKLVFLKKHFILYSCILFIKFNTLRSFCKNLLCFSKMCVCVCVCFFFFFFFFSIEAVFWSIEIAIKNLSKVFFFFLDVLFFVCLVKVDPKILWVGLLLLLLLLLGFSFRLANHEQKSLL